MSVEAGIARHYATGGITDRILAALETAGVARERVTPADLKPVDEFHIGGAQATRDLIGSLDIRSGDRVLDIGSGLGGTARMVAEVTGARVDGVDLTPEFVEAATEFGAIVGADERVRFRVGSALDLPFDAAAFDVALLLHVGMNIADKPALMSEVARVLRPGGTFAVYDVIARGRDPVSFPVPWAELPEHSFLDTLDGYRAAAAAAGFDEVRSRDCSDVALQFFADQRARLAAGGAPVLGVHLLMGDTAAEKFANMVASIGAGRLAPTELILRRRA